MTASVKRGRTPAPPLGVVASLIAGFEAVNAQLGLTLLPLALDLFLWLGPRLSILPLVRRSVQLLDEALATPPPDVDPQALQTTADLLRQSLLAAGRAFNLFSFMSTAPLGVPSLLAGQPRVSTPLGAPSLWPIDNGFVYLLLLGSFVLLGLLLGGAYFSVIALQVRDGRVEVSQWARHLPGDWARLTALALLYAAAVFILGAPTLVVMVLLDLISPILGVLVVLAGMTLILWLLVFGSFALPGIVLQRRGLLGALWDSVRLAQVSLPQTMGLFLAVFLINWGLNFVWNIPGDDSWWLLVGLIGHAIVVTALTAAVFVFYKDRYRWWLENQQALRNELAPR